MSQRAFVLARATTAVVLVLRATFTRSRISTTMRLYLPLAMMLTACNIAPEVEPVRQVPPPVAQAAEQAATTPPATQTVEQAAAATPATQVAEQADATATSMASQGQDDVATRADRYLRTLAAGGAFNGSVLLARDGEILLRRGYGLASREHDVPNTSATKFQIAGITMQFTAMAILLLQEQGKVKVADRICLYVVDCPEAWQAITIHHLLTHQSGIPDLIDLPEFLEIKRVPASTTSAAMTLVRDKPLLFEPGSSGSASRSNYIVLGNIIEVVAGQPYPIFMREQIFEPLDMQDTGISTRAVLKNAAAGYSDRGRLNAVYPGPENLNLEAALGMYSTVEDLYRWDQALYTEQLVPKAALDTMFTRHVVLPETQGYGYGWELFESDGRRVVLHLGARDGYNGMIWRVPDDNTVVIVLTNMEWPDIEVYGESENLARMIFAQP